MDRIVQVFGICPIDGKGDLLADLTVPLNPFLQTVHLEPAQPLSALLLEILRQCPWILTLQDIDSWICHMPDYIPYRRHKIIVLAARVLINFDLEDFGPFQLNGWLLR